MACLQAPSAGHLHAGEQRYLSSASRTTFSSVGDGQHAIRKLGSAGTSRRLGIWPTVSWDMWVVFLKDTGIEHYKICMALEETSILCAVSSGLSAVHAQRQSAQ
jgi:hypothetical protein